VVAVCPESPRPRHVIIGSHKITLEIEENEEHRIKESGSPSGLSPNSLKAHKLGRDRETSKGGLYKSSVPKRPGLGQKPPGRPLALHMI